MTREDLIEALSRTAGVPHGLAVDFSELTESTNKLAKSEVNTALSDKLFVAARQSAGRGRLGRSFVSDEGGLYMTLLFSGKRRAEDALKITIYAAVCVARALEALADVKVKIKWVNDLFLAGKKLAGILCEGVFDGDGNVRAVLGIGLNVHGALSAEISDIATTLSEHTERPVDIAELAARITAEIYSCADWDFPKVIEEYRARSLVIGKEVRVIKPLAEYSATVLDVDERGALVIRLPDGEVEHLDTGEVSIRLD